MIPNPLAINVFVHLVKLFDTHEDFGKSVREMKKVAGEEKG